MVAHVSKNGIRILVGKSAKKFEDLKSSVIWDITLRSPLEVNRRFEETCRLHLQNRRISQARNQHEAGSKQSFTLFFAWLILRH
jgi:hypothetical protein